MTSPQKGRIFISYRRADSQFAAGRIYDRLVAHFGEEAIFMDVEAIDGGVDFVKTLENAVQSCDVVLVVIGKTWLNIKDERGERRLDNPNDFVRIEVATALERDIRVIPVLLEDVNMPRLNELPENLKKLARRNALKANHQSFNADTNRLVAHIDRALSEIEIAKKKVREETVRVLRRQKRERILQSLKSRRARYLSSLTSILLVLATLAIINILSPEVDIDIGATQTVSALNTQLAEADIAYETQVALATIQALATTTRIPRATSTPTKTSTPTEIPVTPTPAFGVGSTMISEKDGMTLLYVPAGEFQMGSENGGSDEKPVHVVYLDAYWIDQTEVTNAMYAKCVADGVCDQPSNSKSYTRDSYYGNSEFDNYPVIYVSWEDANNYCEWAERRLPTEAEWEKAAGWDDDAQSQRTYPWGSAIDDTYANYNQNLGDTIAVRNYESGKSFYGAYDMAGNLWEWVNDWYSSDYYDNSLESNPLGPESGEYRVLRGGSWGNYVSNLRSAYRGRNDPSYTDSSNGFRCSRSP